MLTSNGTDDKFLSCGKVVTKYSCSVSLLCFLFLLCALTAAGMEVLEEASGPVEKAPSTSADSAVIAPV